MSALERARRKKLLREAEGYLDLIMAMDDRQPLDAAYRTILAENALNCLDQIAATSTVHSIDWYLRGQAYRLCERYSEGIDCLRRSLEMNSENLGAYLALGWCFKRVGKLGLAIEALESALEIGAEQPMVHYNLACYWALCNKASAAAFHLTIAFELSPEFRSLVADEPDFDLIRTHPEFLAATKALV
jgi:tetratricopeptide (TPR) repeat protein